MAVNPSSRQIDQPAPQNLRDVNSRADQPDRLSKLGGELLTQPMSQTEASISRISESTKARIQTEQSPLATKVDMKQEAVLAELAQAMGVRPSDLKGKSHDGVRI